MKKIIIFITILLLAITVFLIFKIKTSQNSNSSKSNSTAVSICQKITIENLRNYCLGVVNKDAGFCQKMEMEDKDTCLALVLIDVSYCQKISQPEEKRICLNQMARSTKKAEYCDYLKDPEKIEDCSFNVTTGLYWDGKSNLISNEFCQRIGEGKPERKTCLALKEKDKSLCGENDTCLLNFFATDLSYCEKFGEADKAACYRSVAMNTKNPDICSKINNLNSREDCYSDYAGHISLDFEICNIIKDKFTKEECYRNVAVYLVD